MPPLEIETPLGPGAFTVLGFKGREQLSSLFDLEVDLVAANDRQVPFHALLGEQLAIRLETPNGVRRFQGICSRISQGAPGPTTTSYRLNIGPPHTLLTHRTNARIFQHLSVPEIVDRVLTDLDHAFHLVGPHSTRDYCVQYRESDFAFVSRLLEDEGIWYFFAPTAAGVALVAGDSPGAHPDLPPPATVTFDPSAARRGLSAITEWTKQQEIAAGKVTLRDTNFELPRDSLEVTAPIAGTVRAGSVTHQLAIPTSDTLELYDYPGEYAQRFDGVAPGGGDQPAELAKILPEGQLTAQRRIETEAASALVIDGTSTCRQLAAGHRFTLERHSHADGAYVLTSVTHDARVVDLRKGVLEYRNTFTCIPDSVPYRPPRTTPRPLVDGVQPAVVVGPGGEETFIDKYGRVKLKFPWDRKPQSDETSSCWVRVSQLPTSGSFSLPEVGDEVLVAFEHGDPDRPYVLGSVFNPEKLPPARQE